MDELAERVYAALVAQSHGTSEHLAQLLDAPLEEITQQVEQLVAMGLLQPSQVAEGSWRPVSPALVLGLAIEAQERDLAAAFTHLADTRAVLGRLDPLFAARRSSQDTITVLTDRDAVIMKLNELMTSVDGDIRIFMTNKPSPSALAQSRETDTKFAERGVRMRSICLDAFLRDKQARKSLQESARTGFEIRTTPTLPRRMIIFAEEHAVVAVDPLDPGLGGLLVSSRPVVALLIELFESYWAQAMPFGDEEPDETHDEISAMELHILRMLADGHKDESIARATGQSVRTVRRVVARLATHVGAKGRFDLALEAARRGWVGGTDEE